MNPEWDPTNDDSSAILPADREWNPGIAKKMFVPRHADVYAAILSHPSGTCEEVVLRGKTGNVIQSGEWVPIHMRLELHALDTVPELHLCLDTVQEPITVPLNYLLQVDSVEKNVVQSSMLDSSTSVNNFDDHFQPTPARNSPEFYPTDLLVCLTIGPIECERPIWGKFPSLHLGDVALLDNDTSSAAAPATMQPHTPDHGARAKCSLILRTPSPEDKLGWIGAIARSIPLTFAPFSEYMSRFCGNIASNSQHSDGKYFSTFHFHLKFVKRVFGDVYQHYNRNHPHAEKLFGKGVRGNLVRAAVRSTHSALYRSGPKDRRVRRGYVNNAKTFLKCLTHIDIDEERRFGGNFTYVLMDSGLFISETGATFTKDMMSKHAMHCNMAEKVRFAGECHFQWADDNSLPHKSSKARGDTQEFWLVLDNNSGTYAPSCDAFCLLKRVFNLNFPDLEVETLCYEDPQMTLYRHKSKSVQLTSKVRRNSYFAARRQKSCARIAPDEDVMEISELSTAS